MMNEVDVTSHPAFRRRGDGPVFTATKCPPGPGLSYSCELPFGFIWTPMSPSSSVAIVSNDQTLPPVICLTCLAYINPYSIVEESTGVWTCSLCGEHNVAPTSMFSNLSLALVAPAVEYRQKVNLVPPEGSTVNSRSYILALDKNLPCEEVKAVVTTMQKLLLEQVAGGTQVHVALLVFNETVSIYQLGITGMASADVYSTLQETSEEVDEDALIQRRLRMENRSYFVHVRSEHDLATLWLCVSAVFGIQVQQTNCGESQQDAAGNQLLSRKEKLRLRKEARLRKELSGKLNQDPTDAKDTPAVQSPWTTKQNGPPLRCTGEATQCAVDLAIFGPHQEPQSSRLLFFTNGCPNVGVGSIVNQTSSDEGATQNGHSGRPTLHSVDADLMARSIQYFEVTGKYATDNGIGIDVFCTGAESLGIPVLQALVNPSGGYALSHDSFASPSLTSNLSYVVTQTQLSIADCGEVPDTQETAPTPSVEHHIEGCIADIHISSYVTPTHVGGAGTILDDKDQHNLLPNERAAFAAGLASAASRGYDTKEKPSGAIVNDTLTRIRFGRYDPLSTMSAMLQLNEEFLPDDRYAVVQCIIRFVDPVSHELVTRVSTNRLPVARSVNDFLESTDEEAVPVILGKEAVYRSIVGREEEEENVAADVDHTEFLAYEAQSDLDATVHRISGAFRLLGLEEGNLSERILAEEGRVGSSNSSLDFAFPPELVDALHRLFHLRRGSLLSPGPLQSADDRAEKRSLFLRLPLDDCLCMMAPSLWSAGMTERDGQPSFSLEQIPSDTLTLWDNRIIAADHHDTLFVWSGKGVLGPEYDNIREQCKKFLLERSKNRFPMPHFHTLAEGDSMSRRFTARLAPSHADPVEHQMVHFPALSSLSAVELTALREKFRFYDEATDNSFRRWFWSVASASSTARDDGMSLCE